jgi:hypothetical protein
MSRCILYIPPKLIQELKHFIIYFLSHSFVPWTWTSWIGAEPALAVLLLANRFSISHEVIKKSRKPTVMI